MAIASLAAKNALSKGDAASVSHLTTIPLFGSRKLMRQGSNWTFVCNSEEAQPLTERESMFINAALNAARGQA